ncbi:NUDIX hydrolase, partial [Streptomyces sp. NPDC058171]
MRTVRETSAGGLVVNGLGGPRENLCAALIGRTDRRGRLLWSLPKGHIEQGETAEQTAMREVQEETGIQGTVLASLGSIDYWFVTEGRRVHKTVHHYLLRCLGGELSDEDVE